MLHYALYGGTSALSLDIYMEKLDVNKDNQAGLTPAGWYDVKSEQQKSVFRSLFSVSNDVIVNEKFTSLVMYKIALVTRSI